MLIRMNNNRSGFTFMELLVAIVVIGILVSIVLVNWSGVIFSTGDKAREQDVRQWSSAYDVYKTRFGGYPILPTGDTPSGDVTACLGSFAASPYNHKCGMYNGSTEQYINDSGSSAMLDAIKKISNANKYPENSGPAINSMLVGPIVYVKQTTSGTPAIVTVTTELIGFFQTTECSSMDDFTDISSSLPTSISSIVSTLPSDTTVKTCAIIKTLSYSL